jgi:RNA polymerase sigma-70 factor (ECF subfamily)
MNQDWQNEIGTLEAFRAGRPTVLSALYRGYTATIQRYVLSLVRAAGRDDLCQPSEAADIVQEVFERAFSPTARRNYDGRRDFGPYLITIARHRVIDHLRARAREVLSEPDELSGLAAARVEPPADDLHPGAALAVARCLDGLPAPSRHIYHQRFVLGRSQAKSAAALGMSRSALRCAEARLYRDLRQTINGSSRSK